VKAVDTSGAGDAFLGSLAAYLATEQASATGPRSGYITRSTSKT
jgi:sugar/nucleoside kinase (ribokinase family)